MEVDTGNTAVEAAEVKLIPIKKVAKSTKSKAIRTKSSHPPTSEMVNAAIKQLKDRKGSSLQAIKKYIATTYKIDGEKVAPFVKRYLKSAVTSGAVVQTKGKGASGSFKLSVTGKPSEVKPKVQSAKKAVPKKVPAVEKKTALTKKIAAPKKASLARKMGTNAKKTSLPKKVPAKQISPAKIKAKVETKSISKSKKSVKAPAAKTKTPKPKKVTATKALKAAKN